MGINADTVGLKPPTIYDVARLAGVSHQSVSRYIRGIDLRPATKQKIEGALSELDYRPNLTARSLTTGRSHRIGVLTHEISQVGPGQILHGATAAAREAGYVLDVLALDMGDAAEIKEALALLTRHDLAGILALASTDEMRDVFRATSFAVPVVVGSEPDEQSTTAGSDLSAIGIPRLIEHLAALGHRDFLHIAGPPTWSAARNRARAYDAAIERLGLRSLGTVAGDWSARSGHTAATEAFTHLAPTAVIAANDQMALGAMRALADRGMSVPGDVSVTGVDDMPEAAYFTPSLTTLRLNFEEQGRNTLRGLLALVDGTTAPEDAAIHAELVMRESVGVAPRP